MTLTKGNSGKKENKGIQDCIYFILRENFSSVKSSNYELLLALN